jgi:hypothetical protein
MDMCKCKCYYDAKWMCQDDKVVCMAVKGIETKTVGDLVCANRGTPKPSCEQTPLRTTRGSYPTAQCLETWATTTTAPPVPTTTDEPVVVTETPVVEDPTETPAEGEAKAEEQTELVIVMDSFSMAAALALVAMH